VKPGNKAPDTAARILRAIEPLIYARRRLTMGILLAITLLLAIAAARIAPDAGFDKSIPLKHPYMQVYKQYEESFGGANTILVALLRKDGDIYDENFLRRLKQATDAVFFLPHIDRSQVQSLFTPNVRYIEVIEGGLDGAGVVPPEYNVDTPPSPEVLAKIRDHVGKAGIVGRLVANDQHGALVQADLLETDPVSGARIDYAEVSQLLEDRVRGRFASPLKFVYKARHDIVAGRDYTIRAGDPVKPGEVLFAAGAIVATGYTAIPAWRRWFAQLRASRRQDDGSALDLPIRGSLLAVEQQQNEEYTPDIEIHIVGFAKVVGDVIEATRQVVLFFVLTLALTLLLLWAYVGYFKLAVLPLACAAIAVIWEFGLLKLLGKGLDPFAILVPFLILSVSVSHGVQYVNAWIGEIADNGRNSRDASLFTWRRLAIYGTMAIITDVAGFAMIALIPVGIVQEMALNACLGMAAIVVTNKVIMPIWLSWTQVHDIPAFVEMHRRRDRVFDGLRHFLSHIARPRPAIAALLIAAVLLGWGLWRGRDVQIGDSQIGVPELLPDSRYNLDNAAVVAHFALGTDLIKVIAETDADACAQYEVMEQVDRLAWHLSNTDGVQSTLSLPQLSRLVYSDFVDGSPKFHVLARDTDVLKQAIAPITPPTGMLNESCSAMPVWTFLADHKARTIQRVVAEVKRFDAANAAEFYAAHHDVDAAYCDAKNAARRATGTVRTAIAAREAQLRAANIADRSIADEPQTEALQQKLADAQRRLQGMDKSCPVNFALASGNVGVMAATNELVQANEKRILVYVYLAIALCVWLSFFEWQGIVAIMLPLLLVSMLAYAVMAILGIGMKIATLPVVALAVGIGVDYGIYVYATFADACAGGFAREQAYFKTLRMTGKAVVFTGATLSLGVAAWLFSGLQFQRDMGKLLVFMFSANMFGAILLLPAIASFVVKPRQLAPGEEPKVRPRH
jgi:predicted RND superfamily exporter protein